MTILAIAKRAAATAALSAAIAAPVAVWTGVGATQARPMSEDTIRGECKSSGGLYNFGLSNGLRWSTCTYRVVGGERYRDYYYDGEYYTTKRV